MGTFDSDKTGAFLRRGCPDCHATGELRIESENINENFEVEKQTVITVCSRCNGTGSVIPDAEKTAPAGLR